MLAAGSSIGLAETLDDQLASRLTFWRAQAFHCAAPSGFVFPSGHNTDTRQPCEDGDMVLFAGLLCAVGEEEGCETVRRSQKLVAGDDLGRWYRSPRRMENGNDADGDGRTEEDEDESQDLDGDGHFDEHERSTFSYDMALGTMLYLVAKRDVMAGQAWWDWLDGYTPCVTEFLGRCLLRGLPRFCAPAGCTIRPEPLGDYAMLAEAGAFLGLKAKAGNFQKFLEDADGKAASHKPQNARMNDEGYSEHIVGVGILLMRLMGREHPDLAEAAAILNCEKPANLLERVTLDPRACASKSPENAFFLFLRDGVTDQVRQSVLDRCPAPERMPVPADTRDWIWQRHNDDLSWRTSMYWDCIFMARLLGIT